MNSESNLVSICAKVCVTSLSVVARNRRMLLYKLNDDDQILEKPKYIIMNLFYLKSICHKRIVFYER